MASKLIENENINHSLSMFNKYKNLLRELVNKNVKLKYRNSVLGIFWSFLQPLLNMIVLSVVFTGIFGRKDDGVICYPVFLFTGRLIFEFFTSATKKALMSFRSNATIIKKVYVPKYMYPLSGVLSNFVTFSISLICLVCVVAFFKITNISHGADVRITWHAIFFFIPVLAVLIFSIGVGLILSVLQVYFRDIEYIWEVVSKLLFYMVPILYPLSRITTHWMVVIIKINPLYSMIELFRQCTLYGINMSPKLLLYAFGTSILTLFVGVIIFNWKSDDLIYHM